MLPVTKLFEYWGLAFITLCAGLVAVDVFYRFIDSDLELHGWRKEAAIAGIASMFQGVGFWFSASLFHGDAFRRPVLVVPFAFVAFVYWIGHLDTWDGCEIGGIALFQAMILSMGLCLYTGQFKLGIIIFAVFALGLGVIASIARSL